MKRETLLLTPACALVLMLVLSACEVPMGGDEYDPPAAEIVEVRVEPDPVVVGDTATFTCVVERNAPELQFEWVFTGGGERFAITDENQYRWVAPEEPGTYFHQVGVSRPGEFFEDVQRGFEVTVVAND